MTRYALAVLLAAAFTGLSKAQDEENPFLKPDADPTAIKNALTTVGKAVDLGLSDGRKAVPQIVNLLVHKDEAIAVHAAGTLGKIGGKLKASSSDEAKKLRLNAATALIKAADSDVKERKKLSETARKSVESFTSEDERKVLRAEIKAEKK